MSVSDPIADMLTRIRNAVRNQARQVEIRRSNVCVGIAQVLKDEGFIADFAEIAESDEDVPEGVKKRGVGGQGRIRIDLKYGPRGEQIIHRIQRRSTPGRRVYRRVDDLPRILDGLGIAIISTSKGIVSDRRAREQRVGGELLCTVE